MVWVRSEYAEELAVVSAWLMALLPWSLTYGRPMGGRYVAIRFPLFIYEALQGFGLPSHTGFLTPLNALDRSINAGLTGEFGGSALQARYGTTDPGISIETVADAVTVSSYADGVWAYLLWSVGLVVLVLAIVLSLLMYFETDVVDRWPYDRVRTMGVLLTTAAVFYAGATIMLYLQFPGIYVPIGPFLYFALGYVLLTVERT
ncbi:MAG TPA: hypothetical protein VJ898_08555 [Natrialbaceae archaeon]|nr:hypothetical protein [Natrialbaceae archaeon]